MSASTLDPARSALAPAYLFRGPERAVWQKQAVLRRRFAPAQAVRLGAASGEAVVAEAVQPSFDPARMVVVDGRGWKAIDWARLREYLDEPTPGVVLAIHVKGVIPKAHRGLRLYSFEEGKPEWVVWDLVRSVEQRDGQQAMAALSGLLDQGCSPYALAGALTGAARKRGGKVGSRALVRLARADIAMKGGSRLAPEVTLTMTVARLVGRPNV